MKNSNLAADPDQDMRLNRIFHALSDPTRRALLDRLSTEPQKVTALAEPFEMSLNAVSKHLKTLEKADLITRDTSGRTSICFLKSAPLHEVQDWLDQYTRFWNETLGALSDHMDRQAPEDDQSGEQGS